MKQIRVSEKHGRLQGLKESKWHDDVYNIATLKDHFCLKRNNKNLNFNCGHILLEGINK